MDWIKQQYRESFWGIFMFTGIVSGFLEPGAAFWAAWATSFISAQMFLTLGIIAIILWVSFTKKRP